jgi:hypothetical protein
MNRPLLVVLAILATTGVALADCPGGCPTITVPGGGSTSNNGTNTGNASAVANPNASNYNSNIFVGQVGAQSLSATGASCQGDYIAPFASFTNLGWGQSYTQFGIQAVIGFNHAGQNECLEGLRLLNAQRVNDLTIYQPMQLCAWAHEHGIALDSPSLKGKCLGFNYPAPVAVAPVVQPTPVVLVKETVRSVSVTAPCINDSQALTELAYLHSQRHRYQRSLKTYHPAMDLIDLQAHLFKVCGVSHQAVASALDGK